MRKVGELMWVSWRIKRRNGNWLENEMNEWELADELAEIVAYCCAGRKT